MTRKETVTISKTELLAVADALSEVKAARCRVAFVEEKLIKIRVIE